MATNQRHRLGEWLPREEQAIARFRETFAE